MSRSKARRLADLIKANLDRLTVDTATDEIKVVDATETEVTVVEAGSGVTLDGKTVSLDIDGLTAETSIASTDLLTIHDVSAGTVVKATIADAVANVTDPNALAAGDNVSALTNDSGYITGNQTITLTGDASGSGTTSIPVTVANDSHSHSNYLPTSGGTMTGELQVNARLDVGTGSGGDHEIRIYKADNNVSDHIQFYNGTTRVGEIGVQDTSWLRINQVTAKNIYTPRYFRADGGLYVDSVSRIQSGGNSYLNVTYNSTGAGGVRLYDSGGVIQSYWYGGGNGEGGLLDNDGNWFVRARTGTNNNYIYCNNNPEIYIYTSYAYAPGSFRSPIFYDSNNTAYYVNPASTSVFSNITVNGYITGKGIMNTASHATINSSGNSFTLPAGGIAFIGCRTSSDNRNFKLSTSGTTVYYFAYAPNKNPIGGTLTTTTTGTTVYSSTANQAAFIFLFNSSTSDRTITNRGDAFTTKYLRVF